MTPDDLRFLLRQPIAFHRVFAEITGSATFGLFLSQVFYWSDKGHAGDGWFYKTQEEWTEETCLTRYEQERARKALRELGILEEERRGVPARLYFRLDIDALAALIEGAASSMRKSAIKDAGTRTLDRGVQQASVQKPAAKSAETGDLSPITEITTETKAESDDHFLKRMKTKYRLTDRQLGDLLLRYRQPDGSIRQAAMWGDLASKKAAR